MSISYQSKAHWHLFFLFPFLAGITAVRSYRASWAKNIIWAFIVFFGFTFGLPEEITKDGGSDIVRYVQEVREMYKKDLNIAEIKTLYKENVDIDILKLTIAIGISRFTDKLQFITAAYAFIFGFFFTRNIWFILERLKGKLRFPVILLILSFILIDPFWNINAFRFQTAVQIFIYGLLPFLFEGKKKGVLICSLTFLVHFSFLLPIGVLWLYILLGNRTYIYFIFFLVSSVTAEVNLSGFNAFIDENVPEALKERTATYRNEDIVENYREGTPNAGIAKKESFHSMFYRKGLYWALTYFFILLFYHMKRRAIFLSKPFLNCLCFTLLIWGIANFMTSLPSGGRFVSIAGMSALPLLIFYIQNQPDEKLLSKKVMLTSPALLLFIIVAIRSGFYYISLSTVLGNPFILFLTDENISLNDLIK